MWKENVVYSAQFTMADKQGRETLGRKDKKAPNIIWN